MVSIIDIVGLISMLYSAMGSKEFVKKEDGSEGDMAKGCRYFNVGNVSNVMIGLSIGDVGLVLRQGVLLGMSLNVRNKGFVIKLMIWMFVLGMLLGISNEWRLSGEWVGGIGMVLGWVGSYYMKKGKYDIMNWLWLIADVIGVYTGMLNEVYGLVIISVIFFYHGVLRVLGKKRKGLFWFE